MVAWLWAAIVCWLHRDICHVEKVGMCRPGVVGFSPSGSHKLRTLHASAVPLNCVLIDLLLLGLFTGLDVS